MGFWDYLIGDYRAIQKRAQRTYRAVGIQKGLLAVQTSNADVAALAESQAGVAGTAPAIIQLRYNMLTRISNGTLDDIERAGRAKLTEKMLDEL